MPSHDQSYDLLLGLIACRSGFVTRDALLVAWRHRRPIAEGALAEALVEHAGLDGEEIGRLEALVLKHLSDCGSDYSRCIAALGLVDSLHGELLDVEEIRSRANATGHGTKPPGIGTADLDATRIPPPDPPPGAERADDEADAYATRLPTGGRARSPERASVGAAALPGAHSPPGGDGAGRDPAGLEEDDPYATRMPPGAGPQATRTPGEGGSLGPKLLGGGRSRFRILRPHARGGLGEVFVARDAELGREVALKEIQSEYADDPSSRTRFLLEAEVTGALEHPGIVPVYGLGHYDDGRPYYAMRFIRGDSLMEAIARYHCREATWRASREGALEMRRLLRRFIDVCNAISYAHSKNILHRDLKPGNIMLGEYGETLVVDWGLARRMDSDGPREDVRSGTSGGETVVGAVVGTPQFMSPEQAAGDLDRLGSHSDIYSLGATLYCVLTGRPPFQGKAMAVLEAVCRGEFPPPRSIDPAIQPGLEAICLKAMAVAPEGRYPDAAALADDVEQFLADRPISSYRDPLVDRVSRWARSHVEIVAVVVGLSVISLMVLSSGQNPRDASRSLAAPGQPAGHDAESARPRPGSASTYLERALALDGAGRHAEAADDYTRSIARALIHRAKAYRAQGRTDLADRDLGEAARLDPSAIPATGP